MTVKKITVILLCLGLFVITGCAPGLNSIQEREYAAMQNDGALAKEKDPTTGAVLGILPGGGSFYARKPGLGIVNLLLWPVSVLWDPISGYQGSKAINYDVTKYSLKRELQQEIAALDTKLASGQIDVTKHALDKSQIEQKYTY